MIDFAVLRSGSTGNCYALHDGKTSLMLECGLPWREIRQALNFQTSYFDGVLISHEHKDHSRAVKEIAKAGLDVYASKGTIDALVISGHRIHAIKAHQQFRLGCFVVRPFDTKHDAVEPLGFLLANQAGDKLLYATDTCYLRYRFKGLTHIAVECNHSVDALKANVISGIMPRAAMRRVIQSHFSLGNVIQFLKANDLSRIKEIWLLHLSDSNADAERFKRTIQRATGRVVHVA